MLRVGLGCRVYVGLWSQLFADAHGPSLAVSDQRRPQVDLLLGPIGRDEHDFPLNGSSDDDLAEQGLPIDAVEPQDILVDGCSHCLFRASTVQQGCAAGPTNDSPVGVCCCEGHLVELVQVTLEVLRSLQTATQELQLVPQPTLCFGSGDRDGCLPLIPLLVVLVVDSMTVGLSSFFRSEDVELHLFLKDLSFTGCCLLHFIEIDAVGFLDPGPLLYPGLPALLEKLFTSSTAGLQVVSFSFHLRQARLHLCDAC